MRHFSEQLNITLLLKIDLEKSIYRNENKRLIINNLLRF